MMVAARSIENVIVPPAGHSNVRVLKYMCFALSRNWIVSCPRVYGTAATRKKPSCTITTASGSRYCQNPPSGSGNPAGIQSPSPVTTDAKFEYSIICFAGGASCLLIDDDPRFLSRIGLDSVACAVQKNHGARAHARRK